MDLTPNEIDLIEDAGTLDGYPVKLIRTKGGFWIAVSKLRGKFKEEAIAAGSHPAIVKYNIEKQYPGFQPAMMKSEYLSDGTIVEQHSHFLSEDLRKSGHDIYSVQRGTEVNFEITKHNTHVSSAKAFVGKDMLTVTELNCPKEFVHALSSAATEKALMCGVSKIKIKGE